MAKKQEDKDLDTFQWIGVSARGKKLEGELSGSSIALVKAQLRKQGITPSKVKRKAKPLFANRHYAHGGCAADSINWNDRLWLH